MLLRMDIDSVSWLEIMYIQVISNTSTTYPIDTTQSRLVESQLFEVPFRPNRCAVVNVISMLRTESVAVRIYATQNSKKRQQGRCFVRKIWRDFVAKSDHSFN